MERTIQSYHRVVVQLLLLLRSEGRPLDPARWTLEDAARIKAFRGHDTWSLWIISDFARFAGSAIFEEAGIPPPLPRRNVRWLSREEARAVLEAVQEDPFLAFLAMLGLGQGMRRVEWRRLRVEDVDIAQGRLLIRGKGRGTPKLAYSPLHPSFASVFARYLAHREAVVEEGRLLYPECPVPPEALVMVSKRAHGLRPCSDTALDAAVHAIEVRVTARGRPLHLSSHMLRRSGATMLEESLLESPSASRDGVYRTVQEFLRHENLATTMKYLESNPQRQRKALDLYGEALPWAEPRT